MSNRQARIARKAAQREGAEVYTHIKPTTRKLNPVQIIGADLRGNRVEQQNRPGRNETKRRIRRYGSGDSAVAKEFQTIKEGSDAEGFDA